MNTELTSKVHGHDNMYKIIVTNWLDDARLHCAACFQRHLGSVDNVEDIGHIFNVKRNFNGFTIHIGIYLSYIVARFSAGGGAPSI